MCCRFCPVDLRCGIELDEIDPAVWALLEAATDEYIVREDAAFDACARLLVHNMVDAWPRPTQITSLGLGTLLMLLHKTLGGYATSRYTRHVLRGQEDPTQITPLGLGILPTLLHKTHSRSQEDSHPDHLGLGTLLTVLHKTRFEKQADSRPNCSVIHSKEIDHRALLLLREQHWTQNDGICRRSEQ